MSEDKKSKSNCECECVETLAKQLRKNKGDLVTVYERSKSDDFAQGTIKDVIDDSVLVLEEAVKLRCFCGQSSISGFTELFISICEITEFGVITEAQAQANLDSFK